MASEGETPLLQVPNVRHKKKDGILVLTSARVAWCPEEMMDTFVVNHPYNLIKAQRISAEGHHKVQLQLILHANNTQVNFHFTGVNPLEDRNRVKEILQDQLARFSLQVNPELEAKTNLLKSDPALYQLYNDLVVGRLISAEEFWANRFSEGKLTSGNGSAKGQPLKLGEEQQEIGLPSAFLADVQVQFDGCNKAKYNITTDAIEAIFKTYPSVKAKHAEMVPRKMSEEEFWLQFFQSQLFHRDSVLGAGNSRKSFFTDVLVKEQKSIAEVSKQNGRAVKLNTTETSQDALGESGYSIIPDVETASSSSLPLLQRCNYHSNMVLRAILNEYDPESSNPSLDSSPSASSSSLKLTPSQYIHESRLPGASICSLAQQMASWNTQQLVVDPAVAQSAIVNLVPGSQLMATSECSHGDGSSLTQEQQTMLFRHQAAIAELLRHFWSCFPARTPQLEEKAHKMYQCLVEYQDSRLSELVASLGHSDEQKSVQHLRSTVAAAVDHYHMWQARRNSQPFK